MTIKKELREETRGKTMKIRDYLVRAVMYSVGCSWPFLLVAVPAVCTYQNIQKKDGDRNELLYRFRNTVDANHDGIELSELNLALRDMAYYGELVRNPNFFVFLQDESSVNKGIVVNNRKGRWGKIFTDVELTQKGLEKFLADKEIK